MPLTREGYDAGVMDEAALGMRATPAERAGYIMEMVGEMERMAIGADLGRLRALLQEARVEAAAQASIQV